MRVVSSAKKRVAIVVAIVALGVATSGCIPDSTGAVGPADPFRAQIFDGLNKIRRDHGVAPFDYSPKLEILAQIWSGIMGNGVGLKHQNLADTLNNNTDYANFYTLGENILVGPWLMGAQNILNAFMNSPPHRDNILSRNFNVVGVGFFGKDGQIWICLDFGGLY
ncbi:MAG: CAP domain-containing protein [Acidimicrobiia bacterium]